VSELSDIRERLVRIETKLDDLNGIKETVVSLQAQYRLIRGAVAVLIPVTVTILGIIIPLLF
jgi:hypothetical protein